jgi:hypothetical protein
MYGPTALGQDQKSESASLHSRYGRSALSAQRVAPERAALGEEKIQRGSVSEELDAWPHGGKLNSSGSFTPAPLNIHVRMRAPYPL